MILSWLSKLLASLLVGLLFVLVLTQVFSQTLLSSHYLEGQLDHANAYNRLSVALSDELVQNAGVADPQLAAKAQTVLTPDILKQRINAALEQLETYYKGGGQRPQISFNDLLAQAQSAGLPISQDSSLATPVTLGSSNPQQAEHTGNVFGLAHYGSLIAAVVAALLLTLICWKRHSYVVLAGVLISLGIMVALAAVFFTFAPGTITHFIHFGTDSNAFSTIIRDVLSAISHDLGKHFAIIAGASLAIGIGVRIWLASMRPKPSVAAVPQPAKLPR